MRGIKSLWYLVVYLIESIIFFLYAGLLRLNLYSKSLDRAQAYLWRKRYDYRRNTR